MPRKTRKVTKPETVNAILDVLKSNHPHKNHEVGHPVLVNALKEVQGTKSLTCFAQEIGCSTSYLSEVYNGTRELGPETLYDLGIEKVVRTDCPSRVHSGPQREHESSMA